MSDGSSDLCSSDLPAGRRRVAVKLLDAAAVEASKRLQIEVAQAAARQGIDGLHGCVPGLQAIGGEQVVHDRNRAANLRILHEFRSAEQGKDPLRLPLSLHPDQVELDVGGPAADRLGRRLAEHDVHPIDGRSEEHTSELQSLMRISYAVLCLK